MTADELRTHLEDRVERGQWFRWSTDVLSWDAYHAKNARETLMSKGIVVRRALGSRNIQRSTGMQYEYRLT